MCISIVWPQQPLARSLSCHTSRHRCPQHGAPPLSHATVIQTLFEISTALPLHFITVFGFLLFWKINILYSAWDPREGYKQAKSSLKNPSALHNCLCRPPSPAPLSNRPLYLLFFNLLISVLRSLSVTHSHSSAPHLLSFSLSVKKQNREKFVCFFTLDFFLGLEWDFTGSKYCLPLALKYLQDLPVFY